MEKTPDEILRQHLPIDLMLANNADWTFYRVIDALEEYGKQQYNQAIRLISENAKTKKVGNSGSWLDAEVDKESILELLK